MTMTAFRLPRLSIEELMSRRREPELPNVGDIVERVRLGGDAALAELAARFGDPPPRAIEREEMKDAYDSIDGALRDALHGAADRIAAFARAQRAALTDLTIDLPGGRIGHRVQPVRSAGAYVPGGGHPLPSSLLMCTIPARVAGVSYVAVCSPKAAPETLAAAYIVGIDAFYVAGGVQAIAALAFGTETIPSVDLIVGPGNAYVTAAKRLVYGVCGIDALAGPSEIIIVAAGDANPEFVAADLLAQAEHDVLARAILLTDDQTFADAVEAELEIQLEGLQTAHVAREALESSGGCAVLPLDAAIKIANAVAPEHLHLQGKRAEALADAATSYGELFIGSQAAEVFGDYGTGPNHVLPTSGSARFSSGLSVLTFLTLRTYQQMDAAPGSALIEHTARLAEAEGLAAHRRSALLRYPN